MPIDLGLKRVTQLLAVLGNPHTAYNSVHIAGTNGKGSICSYLSSVFTASQLTTGKFTSPHLIRRSDCIHVDDCPVADDLFAQHEAHVKAADAAHGLHCTEFELLTCTAFALFRHARVGVAVVETGLGGRLDATNVLQAPANGTGVLATGISKIGLDHEGILGSTLGQIAMEKAGIMKPGVACFVDGTNDAECVAAFQQASQAVGAPLTVITAPRTTTTAFGPIGAFATPLQGDYQYANLSVALKIAEHVAQTYPDKITGATVRAGVRDVKWPGRLQQLALKYDAARPRVPVLLDGAHNGSAAVELAKYIRTAYRGAHSDPVTYVMAVTQGKTLAPLVQPLLMPQDAVIATSYGTVDGMPWISCMDPAELASELSRYTDHVTASPDLTAALQTAAASGNRVVVCGSLYLVGDVLRVHQQLTGSYL